MPEDRLDKLLNEMREQSIPDEEVAAATGRVWGRIAAGASPVCSEFRADLELYASGGLDSSRRLLVEDHLGRCPACRRVLAGEPAAPRPAPVLAMPRRILPAWARWAIAAGLAAGALYLGRDRIDAALAPSGPRATVASADGNLYRLPGGPLAVGGVLGEGEAVRTAMGARAVLRLRDGSLVEVNERTELSVRATWSGQSIHLERGDLIVQAAPQRRGRLRVVTRDTTASVKGTVFAVCSSLAGSLVSVVQGSVEVRQPGGVRTLRRGERAASTAALGEVPVRRTLAWSQNAEKYFALLGELASIESAIAASGIPAPRTQPRLLSHLPAGAVLYVAVPNPGPLAEQFSSLIGQRSAASAVLREWWNSAHGEHLKQLLGRIQTLAPMMGDEVAMVAIAEPAVPGPGIPVFMAEVQPGQRAALEQALKDILAGGQGAARVSDSLVVICDSQARLESILPRLGRGAASPFASEIAGHYAGGVSLLFVWDAAAAAPAGGQPAEALAVLGADKLKYLSFEQRPVSGGDQLRASLVFDGPRTGIASWLATPAVAGSAEYVSASTVAAVSVSTRSPRLAFDELVAIIGRFNPRFKEELAEVESKAGLSVGSDIAGALGTDFTISLERPTIPIPGWVAAIEVNQPALLDAAVRRLADAANRESASGPRLVVEDQQSDGRSWTVLRSPTLNLALSWTYDRGYWLISTDRALAVQAIATRAAGFPLVRSQQFRAALPATGSLHQSAFFWLNTQGPLADALALFGGETARNLLQSREPVLVVVNGERERIQAVSRTRLMSMLLTMMMAGPPRAGQIGNAAGSSTY